MQQESNSEHSDDVSGFTNPLTRNCVRDFAGKLAHDFNNLLTPLLAYPQLIRSDLPQGSTSAGLLDVIEETSETMAHVASRLVELAISRKDRQHPIALDKVVAEVLADLDHDNLAFGITIVPPPAFDESILVPHDVLTGPIKEICINALESMDGEGVLTITTELLTVDDADSVVGEEIVPGVYVCIHVHDTGQGMTQEVRDKAFDPFFSKGKQTKARGAGLGLPIALSAVGDCGGRIAFGEADADGFTVTIVFPTLAPEPDEVSEGEVDSSADDADGVRFRVLVVDDEQPIVELFKLMLESAIPHIDVDVADNGMNAVESFRERRHQVIVMDLHMPIMDGKVAFSRLAELCKANGWEMPGMIFCTGYAPPNGIQDGVSGTPEHYLLQKPVTTEILVNAVKARLTPEL